MKSLIGGMYCALSGYRLSSTAMSILPLLTKGITDVHAPGARITELGIEPVDRRIREKVLGHIREVEPADGIFLVQQVAAPHARGPLLGLPADAAVHEPIGLGRGRVGRQVEVVRPHSRHIHSRERTAWIAVSRTDRSLPTRRVGQRAVRQNRFVLDKPVIARLQKTKGGGESECLSRLPLHVALQPI